MAKIALRVYNREIEELIDQGNVDEGIAHSRHILKTLPKHVDTYRLLGKAYLEGQRYGDAADILQRVLSAIPDDFISHVGMSIIREDEGNLDASLWHMERAFEVQPSNQAIQNELRRLYGRRDNVEPPKIRLTRGALARMYAQGDLYEQSIAELRAALAEDPQRPDLQVLLADMYYKAGKPVEAAEVSNQVLNKLPHCLEVNRLMAQILKETGREDEALPYQQRVEELDPYSRFSTQSYLNVDEVPDNAVTIDRLEWDPTQMDQAVSGQPAWASSLGVDIDAGSSGGEELPDWLSDGEDEGGDLFASEDDVASPFADLSGDEAGEEMDWLADMGSEETETDFSADIPAQVPAGTMAESDDELPDFMKEAGWDIGDGEEAESGEDDAFPEWLADAEPAATPNKAAATAAASGAAADLFADDNQDTDDDAPDWMSEFAAGAEDEPAATPADDLPDWLQEAGPETGAPAAAEAPMADPDFLQNIADEVAGTETQPVVTGDDEDLPDWLSDMETSSEAAPPKPSKPVSSELNDLMSEGEDAMAWLESLGSGEDINEADLLSTPEESTPAPAAAEKTPDWLTELDEEAPTTTEPATEPAAESEIDWLSELDEDAGQPATPAAEPAAENEIDWLSELDEDADQPTPPTAEPAAEGELDWLSELDEGTAEPTPAAPEPAVEDDTDNWLAQLDTGATPVAAEPEAEGELDWLNELDEGTTETASDPQEPAAEGDLDWLTALDEDTDQAAPPASETPAPVSAQTEADEAMDWLESLAGGEIDEADLLTETAEPEAAAPAQTEEAEEMDWLSELDAETPQEPAPETPTPATEDDTDDWLAQFEGGEEPAAAEPAAESGLNWLSELDETAPETPAESPAAEPIAEGDLDWLTELDETTGTAPEAAPSVETPAQPASMAAEEADDGMSWLEDLASGEISEEDLMTLDESEPESAAQVETPAAEAESLEWLEGLVSAEAEQTPVEQVSAEQVPEEPVAPESIETTAEAPPSAEEEDEAMAWLEDLAVKQGVGEDELQAIHEAPSTEMPEWLQELDEAAPVEEPPAPTLEETALPAAEEADDGMSWLEDLASGEISEEDLMTIDEAITDELPADQLPAEPAPAEATPPAPEEPTSTAEESMAWLENLAAEGIDEVETPSPKEPVVELPVEQPPEAAPEEDEDAMAWLASLSAGEISEADLHTTVEEPIPPERAPAEPTPTEEPVAEAPIQEMPTPPTTEEEDAALAWLESLAAKQGASEEELVTAPEKRTEQPPQWLQEAEEEAPVEAAEAEPVAEEGGEEEIPDWLEALEVAESMRTGELPAEAIRELEEAEAAVEAAAQAPVEEVPVEEAPVEETVEASQPVQDETPEWLQAVEEEQAAEEAAPPLSPPEWLRDIEEDAPAAETPAEPTPQPPEWLPEAEVLGSRPGSTKSLADEQLDQPQLAAQPTGTDMPPVAPPAEVIEEPVIEEPVVEAPVMETPAAAPAAPAPPAPKPTKPKFDPEQELDTARQALSSGALEAGMESYNTLIKKNKNLDDVIADLQAALFNHPVEITLWQTLGDAYMKADRLQEALDAYTKAEELLR
ncbi:MAG: tetratricopeptide repeat protein [Anaerolineales bacterium]|nr:tetratricopeptide repeat protein [Anaerolineales bacterium]